MPYRPTERTEARKAAARETILAAALDQVAAGGYASASVQAVARRAGVATGTVYRHFPSKADLFADVFQPASARELPEQDVETVAAGLVGAIGEALVGPLSPAAPGRLSRNEALVASLVQFCLAAIHTTEEPRHGRDPARRRLHA